MKIIPYIRFVWAISMSFSYVRRSGLDFHDTDNIELFLTLLSGLIALTFVAYCIIMGLQEIRSIKIVEARYFELFGILFELLIFAGGLYLLSILLRQQSDFWRIGLIILWQLGLLILLIVDLKRIRAN